MAKTKVMKFDSSDVLSQFFASMEDWESLKNNPNETIYYGVTLKKSIGDFEKGDYIPAVMVSFTYGYMEFLTSDADTEDGEEERIRFAMDFGKIKLKETEITDDDEEEDEDESEEDEDSSDDDEDDDDDDEDDDDDDEEEEAPKKRRGRPAKAESPKKRGRPAKKTDDDEDDDDDDEEEEAPKKRRGRPAKKTKNDDEDEDEAPKKRRGRPAKKVKDDDDDDDDWDDD